MVEIDAEFVPATIPDDEVYEGTDVDPNVMAHVFYSTRFRPACADTRTGVVVTVLPKGSKIEWAASHGASFWAISHKIIAELTTGAEKSYFLKMYMHEDGKQMALGEFESTKAWYERTTENVPKPIGTGECANRSGKHFCLLEFRDMSDDMPAASDLVSILARVH